MSVLLTLMFAASPQWVALDEDFDSQVFPPTGWNVVHSGAGSNWQHDGFSAAFHDDLPGFADSSLLTPPLDFSSSSAIHLHLLHSQRYSVFRHHNRVEATLDGGLTFRLLEDITGPLSGDGLRTDLDLGSLAGHSGVRLNFHYAGDGANEWGLDRVRVDDQPYVPPQHWPNLPALFRPVQRLTADFEGGMLDAWMAINELDEETRLADAEAWVNYGQYGLPTYANSGSYAIEMGGAPSILAPHFVANALVVGVDGRGFDAMTLHFSVKNLGEESDPDDGVFLSPDGLVWTPLVRDWALITNYSRDWVNVRLPLSTQVLPVNARYYLAFAQADNFSYDQNEGIALDDIRFSDFVSAMQLEVRNLVAGGVAEVEITRADLPSAAVSVYYSLTGAGPMSTPFGDLFLSLPILHLDSYFPDEQGRVLDTFRVPVALAGRSIWMQALQEAYGEGGLSNPLALVVQ